MRWMISFEKNSPLDYVSHLDLMRNMQRLFRRAGFPIAYSAGFHPHPILSFAMAMPVGATSSSEYLELETTRNLDIGETLASLNQAAPEGLVFKGIWPLEMSVPGLMALVDASRWEIRFDRDMTEVVKKALAAEALPVSKKKDGKQVAVDIRPGIRELESRGCVVCALLDAGSRGNVPPQLLADALLGEASLGRTAVRRTAMLAKKDGQLVPLEKLFEGTHE